MSSSEIPPFAAPPATEDAGTVEPVAPVEADLTAPADAEIAPAAVPEAAETAGPEAGTDPAADAAVEPAADGAAEPAVAAGTDPTAQPDPVAAHIADQLVALDTVGQLPLAEHVQLYQHLHAELQDALADIDGS